MTRYKGAAIGWLLVALACPAFADQRSAASFSSAPQVANSRPNIIFILADDIGWKDLSSAGSRYYETPNIDRLAQSGLQFSNAYSAGPVCSPTRAAFMTGQSPARLGFTAPVGHLPEVRLKPSLAAIAAPGVKVLDPLSVTRLSPDYVTLPTQLRNAGYVTAHFGKWHLGFNRAGHPEDSFEPRNYGFISDFPAAAAAEGPMSGYFGPFKFIPHPQWQGTPGQQLDEFLSSRAADFIRSAPRERPFYLNYWPYAAHYPWGARKDYIEHFETKRNPQDPQQNPIYAAMLKSLDDSIGTIITAVEQSRRVNDTVIVFSADNGGQAVPPSPKYPVRPAEYQNVPITSNLPARSGKASLYEGGSRVPMIIRWPGVTKGGAESITPITVMDLNPTFLSMAGLRPTSNQTVDGFDMSGYLRGEPAPQRDIFTFFPHGDAYSAQFIPGLKPGVWVRRGDWKLIRFFADGKNGIDRLELYNLRTDIGESINLAANEVETATELNNAISRFLSETRAVIPKPNPAYDPKATPMPVRIDR